MPPLKASSGVRSISSNDIQSMAGGGYKGGRKLLWGWSLSARAKRLPPHYFLKICSFKPPPPVEKEKKETPAAP
ncbi:hypothetical protein, partial [Helicobacter marmotae]|uniref:hypothetical protein n=1 Tax=Helicobacter marmotae TaxID=152490 RepID=UPI001B86E32C